MNGTPAGCKPSKWRDIAASIALMAVIAAIGINSFLFLHRKLRADGMVDTIWQSAAVWLAMGLVCALFWPLVYRKGMRGLWRESLPQFVLLALLGPWAFVFGFPL